MLEERLELGFILSNGKCYFKEDSEKGHIEVAVRILNLPENKSLKSRYEKSVWGDMNNPVDFLVFEEGALKVGIKYGTERVVVFYPYMISRKTDEAIAEYRSKHYRVCEVYPPHGFERFFHR
ncbi:MAG: hypothetical protein IJH12_08655 [Clostridia bacterium]|nr:hypothetical protein [Clostridia bacterium]